MIHSQDLWKLEFLSDDIGMIIRVNEKQMAKDKTEMYEKGIQFGVSLVNKDLVEIKKKLDDEIQSLQQKVKEQYMIDDLTYEGAEESA